ncbi:MAG: hypothetical protein SH868_18245 [Bythopirellula sp.]|nr:hypothetical protein [Bythopirellula sp.]
MKKSLISMFVLSLLAIATVGCSEKSSSMKETTVSTPGGTTTTTVEKEVEKTGDNPPAAQP